MAYPATITFKHQKKSSRLWAFFTIIPVKIVALLPLIMLSHGVVAAASLLGVVGVFVVLFTGKYPRFFEDVIVKAMRLQWRINSYMACLTDEYPPFCLSAGDHPAEAKFKHRRRSSKLWALLTIIPVKLILVIPHFFVWIGIEIVAFFCFILGIFAVLFTGKYPKSFEKVIVTLYRYYFRLVTYMLCLTDEYPPIHWRK